MLLWVACPLSRNRRSSRHDRKDRVEAKNGAAPVADAVCNLAEVFAHDLAGPGPSATAGIASLYAGVS